jgi:hypothetical protein
MKTVHVLLHTNIEKNIPLVFIVKNLEEIKRKLMMVARQFENIYGKKIRISGKLLFNNRMYEFSGSKRNIKLNRTKKKISQAKLTRWFMRNA